jgi:hypothetical protein
MLDFRDPAPIDFLSVRNFLSRYLPEVDTGAGAGTAAKAVAGAGSGAGAEAEGGEGSDGAAGGAPAPPSTAPFNPSELVDAVISQVGLCTGCVCVCACVCACGRVGVTLRAGCCDPSHSHDTHPIVHPLPGGGGHHGEGWRRRRRVRLRHRSAPDPCCCMSWCKPVIDGFGLAVAVGRRVPLPPSPPPPPGIPLPSRPFPARPATPCPESPQDVPALRVVLDYLLARCPKRLRGDFEKVLRSPTTGLLLNERMVGSPAAPRRAHSVECHPHRCRPRFLSPVEHAT